MLPIPILLLRFLQLHKLPLRIQMYQVLLRWLPAMERLLILFSYIFRRLQYLRFHLIIVAHWFILMEIILKGIKKITFPVPGSDTALSYTVNKTFTQITAAIPPGTAFNDSFVCTVLLELQLFLILRL